MPLIFRGTITKGVSFRTFNHMQLEEYSFDELDINKTPPQFKISHEGNNIGISKWVSPKRTRSQPFSRVYNTLHLNKRITVIPIRKDEGCDGDHDIINPITLAWMNLLGVYIVLAYYVDAEMNQKYDNKITKQLFDNIFVKDEINKIIAYQSDAHHWNNDLFSHRYIEIFRLSIIHYENISTLKNVNLREVEIPDNWNLNDEINTRNQRSLDASLREINVNHEHERLNSLFKGLIQITNFYDGHYYLTCDEVFRLGENKYLIQESKNTTDDKLPTINEINDAIFKMYLFSNINIMLLEDAEVEIIYRIKLTSSLIHNHLRLNQNTTINDINDFFEINQLSVTDRQMIINLSWEAKNNNFSVIIQNSEAPEELTL